MQTASIISTIKIVLALLFLAYASWRDFKTREVSDRVWVIFAPLAFALTFAELYFWDLALLPYFGLCFVLTAAFAIVLFYAGGFGGADAKALMCLALDLPFYPSKVLNPLFGEVSPIMQTFFPITVFINSVILSALSAVYIFFHNLFQRQKTGMKFFEGEQKKEAFWKKILVLITGYKIPITKLKEKWHIYPLEDLEKAEFGVRRKLLIFPKDEDRDAIVERLEESVKAGGIHEMVWATPGLPMLIFVTAGLILALYLGDIVWFLVDLMIR
ncbi:MAG: A24 family peptidase C-terminal domain-containing protein [Candidatus Bathyarchaeia archaeon]